MTCQVTWADHVTVKAPELLHLRSDKSQHEVASRERENEMSCDNVRSNLWVWTYRGKAANLLNILFVALCASWSPRRASWVPEGVIVLKWMLTWPWNHHLQTRENASASNSRATFRHWVNSLGDAHWDVNAAFVPISYEKRCLPFSWIHSALCRRLRFFPSHCLSVSLGPGRGLHCHHLLDWIYMRTIYLKNSCQLLISCHLKCFSGHYATYFSKC